MPARRRTSSWAEGVGCALIAAGAAAWAFHAIPSLQLLNRYTVMVSAFIPYGLPAFGGAAVIFAPSPRRSLKSVAVSAVAAALLLAWWAKPYWPSQSSTPASRTSNLTLLTMNLRCNAPGIRDLAAVALRTNPDVVVVEGLDSTKRDSLGQPWCEALPYSTFHPMPHLTGCGTFVFSRTPLRTLSSPEDPQPAVEVDRPNGPFVLLPVDFPTPSKGVRPWVNAFTHLTEAATTHRGRPLVVVGDFSAVREHEPLRRLLQDTGLRDAAELAGAGWTPTFPSRSWHPPLIGLDHAFISPGLDASDVFNEPIAGQEHRALTCASALSDLVEPSTRPRGRVGGTAD